MGYYYYMDPSYLLIMLISVILAGIAQGLVTSRFSRYSRVAASSGLTGTQTAQRLLSSQGLYSVMTGRVSGRLTDHYDPRTNAVNLSDSVADSNSVAAVAVAAHECGHAVQQAKGYVPLRVRSALVPVVNFASQASWFLIILGLIFSRGGQIFIEIGIILFAVCVLFQLVTLPVEFNASHRGLQMLTEQGIVSGREEKQARSVLVAAALTYVASALTAVLQLLRLILIYGRRNRD